MLRLVTKFQVFKNLGEMKTPMQKQASYIPVLDPMIRETEAKKS